MATNVVVFSDAHADWSTMGNSRLADVGRAMEQVRDAAIRIKATDVLFLGDLCDPDCGPVAFHVMAMAMSFSRSLVIEGIASHWMAGNHDVLEDGSGGTTLGPLRHLDQLVQVHDRPTLTLLGPRSVGQRVPILFLPFTASCAPYDPAKVVAETKWPTNRGIIAGHLHLPGIHPGSETLDMPRGRALDFPFQAIEENAPQRRLLLNGHYHERQVFRGVHIPGSLQRLTFGEEHNDPGYFVIDLEAL